MTIPRVLRSVSLVRVLVLFVTHALAVQLSPNAVTATVPADVIIPAHSGEGNFPSDFTGENNGVILPTVVTWSASQNIATDSDIVTGGSLVGAFNVGNTGVGAATVNGVTFNPFVLPDSQLLGQSVSIGNFTLSTPDLFLSQNTLFGSEAGPFTGLSAGYQTLLRTGTQVSDLFLSPPTITLTMGGLALGHQYQFQWFSNVSGPGAKLHSATAGNTITLTDNVTGLEGGLGQFGVGTFVANALSMSITFSSGEGLALLNAFQLRNLSIPEPGTTVMLLAGLVVLASRRNRAVAV